MGKALVEVQTDVEVPFQDCDPLQVAWHGNYFRYFETARSALLHKIGYDYQTMQASHFMWPVVEAHVKYVRPLRFDQHIHVWAGLVEWENRMRLDYRISDAASGKRLTTAYTIQCAVDTRSGELQLVSPPAFLDRLKDFL